MKQRALWKPTEFRNHPVSFSGAMRRGLWRGIVRHVYDGDSYAVFLDKGFFDYQLLDIRLKDVDTPEMVGEKRADGLAAKEAVALRLLPDKPVLIRVAMSTVDLEKRTFERYVADIIGFDEQGKEYDFGEYLVWGGYATKMTEVAV
jgi:endonuclease YncB( thermonuclease family)